jgi:hypothetical protein
MIYHDSGFRSCGVTQTALEAIMKHTLLFLILTLLLGCQSYSGRPGEMGLTGPVSGSAQMAVRCSRSGALAVRRSVRGYEFCQYRSANLL